MPFKFRVVDHGVSGTGWFQRDAQDRTKIPKLEIPEGEIQKLKVGSPTFRSIDATWSGCHARTRRDLCRM